MRPHPAEAQHPLYKALIAAKPSAEPNEGGTLLAKLAEHGLAPTSPTDVMWNFEKFLIDRHGNVAGRFAPDITPDNPVLVKAVEGALGSS